MKVHAKCIERIRDKNGNIVEYMLEDYKENQKIVTTEQLRQAIYHNKIRIDNLKLTKDLKIVEDNSLQTVDIEELWKIISKGAGLSRYDWAVDRYIEVLEKTLKKHFVKVFDNGDYTTNYEAAYICGALILFFEVDRWKSFIYFNDTTGAKEIVRCGGNRGYHKEVFMEFIDSCIKYSSETVSLKDIHDYVDNILNGISKRQGHGEIRRGCDGRYVGFLCDDIRERNGSWKRFTCLEDKLAVYTYMPYHKNTISEYGVYCALYYDIKIEKYKVVVMYPKLYRYEYGSSWGTFTVCYSIDVDNLIELRDWLEKVYNNKD